MADKPDNPFQFWQELKRRKVFRVIAMYVAAAYVIIELSNNVVEPLSLPAWTPTMIIVLLVIGFPFAVIFSWIFDITPEGVKKTESAKIVKQKETPSKPQKRKLKVSDVIIAVLLITVCVLAYPKIFKKDKFEGIRDADGRISIAVMPFENLTGDTTLNWFQRGISSLIINGLGNSSELAVRDDHTIYEVMESMDQVFTAGISPSQAKEVAKKARAETYISGSCQGREGKYWILANLADTESGEIIWTNKVEGNLKSSEYLDLANSLCNEIKNYLEIHVLKQNVDYDFREAYTESAEAYRYFIKGMNSILILDHESSRESLKKALEIDSTFTFASFYIAYTYGSDYHFEEAKIYFQKAYNTKDRLPLKYQHWLELWYAYYFSKNLQEINRYCNLIEESGLESRLLWFNLAIIYYHGLGQYEKAVEAFGKVEEISHERGGDWEYLPYYGWYGHALHYVGNHEKEKEITEIGFRFYPDYFLLFWNQAECALSRGDTALANDYIQKLRISHRELGSSEANIECYVGDAYRRANIIDKAEIHFRNAYAMDDQERTPSLWLPRLLIEFNLNIDEGLELIIKGLEFYPDDPEFLLVKGWGFYKQGKYEEAMNLLKRSEEKSVKYNDELHQLIQEFEQALANQNK